MAQMGRAAWAVSPPLGDEHARPAFQGDYGQTGRLRVDSDIRIVAAWALIYGTLSRLEKISSVSRQMEHDSLRFSMVRRWLRVLVLEDRQCVRDLSYSVPPPTS